VPAAYALDVLTLGQLFVVGFVVGTLTVFFDVAYQSYLPSLVDRDQIVDGNAKLQTSYSAAQITGPGVAGVIIGAITAPFAIILDSLSFVGSALFLFAIRRHEPAPEPRVDGGGRRPSMRTEIAEGLRYVGTHPYLRSIAATTATSNLFSNVAFSILILYLVREIGFTPEQLGLAFSLGAVGFLVGALLANRFARRFGVGPTIVGSAITFGPAALLVAIAPSDLALPFVAASGFLGGLGGAIYNINQVSLRQAITPERMQGRMNATMRFIVWGTIPFGNILGGFLGSVIGLHNTIWIGAIGGLFVFLPVLFSPVRSIKEMPEPLEEPAGPDPKLPTEKAEGGVVPSGHPPYVETDEN
jgi:MFS family permease